LAFYPIDQTGGKEEPDRVVVTTCRSPSDGRCEVGGVDHEGKVLEAFLGHTHRPVAFDRRVSGGEGSHGRAGEEHEGSVEHATQRTPADLRSVSREGVREARSPAREEPGRDGRVAPPAEDHECVRLPRAATLQRAVTPSWTFGDPPRELTRRESDPGMAGNR